jgi:septum site-determining protein MinD
MGQSLVITSGKGGSGKSTVALNLGAALAAAGKAVALVDVDMGMRSLDILCGLEDRIVNDLADVADGLCRVKQAIVKHPTVPGLSLISAAQTRGSDALSPHRAREVMDELKMRFDWVLIDSPAGVGRGFRNAASGADQALIVVLTDPVSMRDAERVTGLLERCDILRPLLAFNRVRGAGRAALRLAEERAERLNLPLIAVIPEDAAIPGAAPERPAALGASPAGRAIRELSRRMMGEDIPIGPVRRERLIKRIARAITQ